ncbi:hypothetical protein ACHAP8_009865 [Fusarium lateritium]
MNQSKELRIVLTSRPEDDIVRFMQARSPLSIRVNDVNHLDIVNYVDNRSLEWISELPTSTNRSQIIRKLMQKVAINAQGMFLYARLLCDLLVRNGDVAGLEEAVNNLPDGLNEAAVPLTSNEIQLAVFTARTGDASRGIESLFLNVNRRCGPIVEERNGYVQFVHFTVHE